MDLNRILIVDDSDPDQFLAKVIIEKFNDNIEILQAYDGQEALELLDQVSQQPDLILLDINMPVMDGHEFLEQYSKRDEQTSVVVMLTSSDQQKDKERSHAYECTKDYLSKPLKPSDLEGLAALEIAH